MGHRLLLYTLTEGNGNLFKTPPDMTPMCARRDRVNIISHNPSYWIAPPKAPKNGILQAVIQDYYL